MIPKKLFWMLGYNNLAIILEQERRHWLMKTDKKKQVQDKLTGDIFQGQIDNIGSDIIIESEKLPFKYDFIPEIKFGTAGVDKILGIANSAFPHSAMVNGLMFTRILSSNFPYVSEGAMSAHHYKIRFENAKECIIPFGGSLNSSDVFADKWICTTANPTIFIMDNQGNYSTSKEIKFSDNITNVVYYYPLTETLQPLNLNNLGYGNYELDAVTDDNLIGYPLFWFTCDQTNVGSNLTFENNINDQGKQIMFISNEGNASKFNAKVYTGIDGDYDATPDNTSTDNYTISCSCKNGYTFTDTMGDLSKPIDPLSITLTNDVTHETYNIKFICNDNVVITMENNKAWIYKNESTYECSMAFFDQNCLSGSSTSNTPLVAIFNVHFDESIPFVKSSSDIGYAGIRMGASNSDVYDKYPRGINKWDGLPEWLTNLEGKIPEHVAVYAMHQTPTSNTDDPNSMQGAGLIIDPGKEMNTGLSFDDNGDPIINNDNIGRVYVLSNDDLEYKNNANEEYPKPARTAARICDIPTSVMQLTGVKGLSPDPIVDKKYVRTGANFSESDKDRLYNTLASRWVRPTALTKNGKPVWEEKGYPNTFAFETMTLPDGTFVNTLDDVDLINHNDFRYHENLNPMVDVTKVSVSISDAGSGYQVNNTGVCVVGGYSFTYVVTKVNNNGGVTEVGLAPDERANEINLANFDMDIGTAGITTEYGTSPTSGNGTGLKIKFYVDYDYYQSIIPKKGDVFDDLFALVREPNGLYVYTYDIDKTSSATPKPGKWIKGLRVSEFEVTSTNKNRGGVSTKEAYINAIVPSVRDLPVSYKDNNEDPTYLVTLQTSSFINIIDKSKTPVRPAVTSDDPNKKDDKTVDLCKFYCEGFQEAEADEKTENSIRNKLKELNVLRFDSYVLWRWVDPSSKNNKKFTFGIVSRSFNNLFTTDSITMLPTNELRYDNFVHTNGNTTIVWDVEGVGVMMWVYDPNYTKKESYWIDAETRDLHVIREEMSYADIDVRADANGNVPEIVKDGKYMFNVMTNNPMNIDDDSEYPIYQQPEMKSLDDVAVDKYVDNTSSKHKMCGNWKLVFPRVQSFRLTNDQTNTEWIPMKMQVIKGRSISDVGRVYDSHGNDVSTKSIIVDEGKEKITVKSFNSNSGKWETI